MSARDDVRPRGLGDLSEAEFLAALDVKQIPTTTVTLEIPWWAYTTSVTKHGVTHQGNHTLQAMQEVNGLAEAAGVALSVSLINDDLMAFTAIIGTTRYILIQSAPPPATPQLQKI